ncbi:MAG: 3-hydroxyacyl-ACP dehydratase FabZ [Synergistaceae bacterium]|jgi:beta-hydroxyacyl-ACP dehydratase FabZ|nr:3-hydroxyacyl-ACP dehydratase FabZ [Synergistaceae bacterium]
MADSVTNNSPYVFDINKIMEYLPHRYPFLLVDRILEIDTEGPEKRVVGIKNVTINEPFFQGHFPAEPVMPGVLILEAMGQVGCVMMANEQEKAGVPAGERRIVFLTTVYEAKFRKPVKPGDQLRTEATLVRFRGKVGKMKFVCTVDGEVAAEAVMGFVSGTTLTAQPEQG